jgi:hypothetical protein
MKLNDVFSNVTGVNTGKVGGKSLPPMAGSPVKFPIVKVLTPGLPGAPGIKMSHDR